MTTKPPIDIGIQPYEVKYREQIISVWEKSVLATHHFLKSTDFLSIRELVHGIDFVAFEVFCLIDQNHVIGFIGVADRKVEMLFLLPDYLGQGLGKRLMQFAISELKANKVDVNEQNESAVKFYRSLGFVTYERTNQDDQGKDYPLLRMKL